MIPASKRILPVAEIMVKTVVSDFPDRGYRQRLLVRPQAAGGQPGQPPGESVAGFVDVIGRVLPGFGFFTIPRPDLFQLRLSRDEIENLGSSPATLKPAFRQQAPEVTVDCLGGQFQGLDQFRGTNPAPISNYLQDF